MDKLFAVLTTHESDVGLIVSEKGPSKTSNGKRAIDKIRMLAITGKFILVIEMADIQKCVQGTHILTLTHQRFIETTTGASNLALL